MDYENFTDLFNDLKNEVENPVLETLGEVGKRILKETIDDTVYHGEFQPNVYLRRYENGGFGDEENIYARKVGEGLIEIVNDTLANGDEFGKRLDEIIEYGKDYNWKLQPPPRPVFQITKNKLNEDRLREITRKKIKELGYETD